SRISDTIREISGWEKEAEAVVERSEAEAHRILEEVAREAREMIASVEARCAAEREALLRSAIEEGEREADVIAREAEAELDRIRETLSSRCKEAVELVLNKMRAHYGGR
ncbi:MAG: hypothetical protein ACE5JI_19865, partial [Acidobacteriota bacterium]